jgi:Domain of unknown function (DUF4421)
LIIEVKMRTKWTSFGAWALAALLWLAVAPHGWAQAHPDSVRAQGPGFDSSYVETYRDWVCITLSGYQRSFGLAITDPADAKGLAFKANDVTALGLGVDYKWFTFEFQRKVRAEQLPNTVPTHLSSYSSLQFGITGRRLWFKNFFQSHRGMYLTSFNLPNDYLANPEQYRQARPDMRNSIYFASLTYIFNHRRYSHMAAQWQLDRQKRSTGSWVAGISLFLNRLDADSLIVPEVLQRSFVFQTDFTTSATRNLGVHGGYLHTFAFGKSRHWFVHLGLIPSLVAQDKRYLIGAEETLRRQTVELVNETRIVLGYNGKKYFSGLSFTGYYFSENLFQAKYSYLDYTYNFVRFFVGIRLKPKFRIPLLDR